jgi:hypothetical protein
MRFLREVGRFVKWVGLFFTVATLTVLLYPPFLPELSYYLNAPGRVGRLEPAQLFQSFEGLPGTGPFGLGPADRTHWTWERVVEVADGRRRFAQEDWEVHRRQELAVESLRDWFMQEDFWRLPKYERFPRKHLNLRACIDEAVALTFHLDGLSERGDVERHAKVLEAALRYTEDLSRTGFGLTSDLVVVAQMCDERLLRHLLRHVAQVGLEPAHTKALARRLEEHFERIGDIRTLTARPHSVHVNEFLLAVDEKRLPRSIPAPRIDRATRREPTNFWKDESLVLADALAQTPREGLARVVRHSLALERERTVPLPTSVRLLGLLIGHMSVLFRPRDPEFAQGAYLRHLEWTALRAGVLAVLDGATAAHEKTEAQPFALRWRDRRLYALGRDGADGRGAGDDLPIWPPAAVRSPALRALKMPGPRLPAAPKPAFASPQAALAQTLDQCEKLGLRWQVVTVALPERAHDIARARISVVVTGERFHRLGALLCRPELAALGTRGEMVQAAGDARELRFDVALMPRARSDARQQAVRVSGTGPRELLTALDRALGARAVERVSVVRTKARWDATALIALDS